MEERGEKPGADLNSFHSCQFKFGPQNKTTQQGNKFLLKSYSLSFFTHGHSLARITIFQPFSSSQQFGITIGSSWPLHFFKIRLFVTTPFRCQKFPQIGKILSEACQAAFVLFQWIFYKRNVTWVSGYRKCMILAEYSFIFALFATFAKVVRDSFWGWQQLELSLNESGCFQGSGKSSWTRLFFTSMCLIESTHLMNIFSAGINTYLFSKVSRRETTFFYLFQLIPFL